MPSEGIARPPWRPGSGPWSWFAEAPSRATGPTRFSPWHRLRADAGEPEGASALLREARELLDSCPEPAGLRGSRAQRARAIRPASPGFAAVAAGDRGRALRLPQHREDAQPPHLPQARRLGQGPGRGPRPRARPAGLTYALLEPGERP